MEKIKIEAFNIIGIAIRTTNENGQSQTDIPKLWEQFMSNNTVNKIPNKMDDTLYALYTAYEKDHSKPYTTIIGCKVENLTSIPTGMVGQSFEGGEYVKFVSKGDVTKGAIYQTWEDIWKANLPRVYTTDFEIYGEKAKNYTNAEVDIMIAV